MKVRYKRKDGHADRPFPLFLNLNHKLPLRAYFQLQSLDIPIAEILHFSHSSRYPCSLIDFMSKLQRIFPIERRQMLFKLCKEDCFFQLVRSCRAEIINGTIVDAMLCKGRLDRRSALFVFVHNKEVGIRQTLDQSPEVGIARYNNKRCNAVTIEICDNTRCHSYINKRFAIGHTFNFDVFNRDMREL